jgi:Ca-activated chloride channel family protein
MTDPKRRRRAAVNRVELAVFLFVALLGLILFFESLGGFLPGRGFGHPEPSILDKFFERNTAPETRYEKEPQARGEIPDLTDILPDISRFPAAIPQERGKMAVEILSSLEKAAGRPAYPDYYGYLIELGREFNRTSPVALGERAMITLRGIPSGVAMDYVKSGKYVPDAYSPAARIWGEALEALGEEIILLEPSLAGNVSGIVLDKKSHEMIRDRYGEVSPMAAAEAAAMGDISFGISNPNMSSAGANFLLSLLRGERQDSPIIDIRNFRLFDKFQSNIPFLAPNHLSVFEAAKLGILDGFLLEFHEYHNERFIRDNFVLTPFGVRHDNPLYYFKGLSEAKVRVLKAFAEFAKSPKGRSISSKYGFNKNPGYRFKGREGSGRFLIRDLKYFQDKREEKRKSSILFLADVSPGMARWENALKRALLFAGKRIGEDDMAGIAVYDSYESKTDVLVHPARFDMEKRKLFHRTAEKLKLKGLSERGKGRGKYFGGTGVFMALSAAENLMEMERRKNPGGARAIFLITKGGWVPGPELKSIIELLETKDVPVHVVILGGADGEGLSEIARISRGAYLSAGKDPEKEMEDFLKIML